MAIPPNAATLVLKLKVKRNKQIKFRSSRDFASYSSLHVFFKLDYRRDGMFPKL